MLRITIKEWQKLRCKEAKKIHSLYRDAGDTS